MVWFMKPLQTQFKEFGELNDLLGAIRTLIWNINRDLNVMKDEDTARVHYAEFRMAMKTAVTKIEELNRKLEDD